MAFPIPKIEYRNVTLAGDTTSGNGTIANIADVSELAVGMVVVMSGIPAGSTIGSIGANSVTLANSVKATATATVVAVEFKFQIKFDYPPIENSGPNIDAVSTRSVSLAGVPQVVTSYLEETRVLDFQFISSTLKTSLFSFLQTWAFFGYTFRYFEDATLSSYNTYELNRLLTALKRTPGRQSYQLELDMRRTL